MSYTPTFSDHNQNDKHHHQNDNNGRLYNPYQDLQIPMHGPMQTLYKLPTSPEFLFQEESIAQRRTWGHNLTFYTGVGCLSGAVVGAARGSLQGLGAIERGDTAKIRVNRVLNGSVSLGARYANRAGVVGLLFAGMESVVNEFRDSDDLLNSVLAGLGTGVVYRAAAGVRSAAVAGAVGAVLVGLGVKGKEALKRYVPVINRG